MRHNSRLAVQTRAALHQTGALHVAMTVEMPLCSILSAMEVVGVRFNQRALTEHTPAIEAELTSLTKQVPRAMIQ